MIISYINIIFGYLLDNQLISMYKSRIVAILMLLSINLLGQKDYGFLPPVSTSVVAETRSAICVPNPTSDRPWNQSKSFQEQVNEAIDAENIAFGKSYPNYNHPSYNSNDALDISAKVLKELRRVYQGDGIADINIEYDLSVIDMAIDHSCAMDLDNTFCHTCPSDGSFGSRIVNRIGSGCYRSGTENIAWVSTQNMEQSILRIIYLMMYADLACCNNGHRENFLKCTYDNNTKIGFGIIRGDIQSSNGSFIDSWIMTWDYVTYRSYPNCGDGCNCNVSIGTPLCEAASGAVLPVELNTFSVSQLDCSTVEITWSTLSETNHDHFILQRSTDAIVWENLSILSGVGDSKEQRKYKYSDELIGLQFDKLYYRLVQQDLDGSVTYSDIASMNNGCAPAQLSLYPNPVTTYAYIKSNQLIKSLKVLDISGKLIDVAYNQSTNRVSTINLESGLYLLSVETEDGKTEVLKLVKE